MNGINALVTISQMKAPEVTDADNSVKPLRGKLNDVKDSHDRYAKLTKTEAGFDNHSKAISETFATRAAVISDSLETPRGTGGTQTAQKQRQSLLSSVLTNIANMKHESLKGIAQNLRG